ncbi:MAG: 3-isopropylmalate dehydratase small subunit [Enterobacterales bacterium]
MKKYFKHKGIIAPLDYSNIDTDIIIPKQFLKEITRIGFGKHVFKNWRFLKDNYTLNPNFILNKKCFINSSILLTRENFGCGSSREHAVWALMDYGFNVIISTSFSDIFYNNSINNGLLLISLSPKNIDELFKIVKLNEGIHCLVDTQKKVISINNSYYNFDIDKLQLDFINKKYDHIDDTMKNEDLIYKYEKNQFVFFK